MSMIEVSLTLLFASATMASVAVLAASYCRAFAVAGDLRRAALSVEERRVVRVRMREIAARPAVQLRLVSQAVLRSQPAGQPALRAAA